MLYTEYRETSRDNIQIVPSYCSFHPWGGDKVLQKFLAVLLLHSVYLTGENPKQFVVLRVSYNNSCETGQFQKGTICNQYRQTLGKFYNFG